jgi:hypothetical protein
LNKFGILGLFSGPEFWVFFPDCFFLHFGISSPKRLRLFPFVALRLFPFVAFALFRHFGVQLTTPSALHSFHQLYPVFKSRPVPAHQSFIQFTFFAFLQVSFFAFL